MEKDYLNGKYMIKIRAISWSSMKKVKRNPGYIKMCFPFLMGLNKNFCTANCYKSIPESLLKVYKKTGIIY
jgi:hypothetical protein